MRGFFIAVACVAVAVAAAGGPASHDDTKRPIMVDSLQPAAAPAAPADHKDAPAAAPAPHERELKRLEASIVDHEQTLGALQKQLEEGVRQKQRLIIAQKLMTAIIALKKAERVLGEVDARITAAKANIKKFGEHAEEIGESIKRSESEHRKEIADLNKKLTDLKGDLTGQEKTLSELVGKRGRIATTVKRWKEHVATLRDAHDASALPAGTHVAAHRDGLEVPEPPSDAGLLSSIGLVDKFAEFNKLISFPKRHPKLDKVVAGDVTHLDSALREVAKRTFAELGQGRFASLRGGRKAADEGEEEAVAEELEGEEVTAEESE